MSGALVGFGAVLVLCLVGIPLAFAILLVGVLGFAFYRGIDAALAVASQQILETLLNPNLTVIPLFVLMGTFIFRANIADDLYEAGYAWMGRLRGGLGHATVLACAGFSAVCGSSVATSATMCRVVMPSMRRYKYDDGLTTGTLAAGGTLGIMIPPSVPMVIYCMVANEDIGRMFIAGIVPGVLLVILYMLAIYLWVSLWPQDGPRGEVTSWKQKVRSLRGCGPVIALFVLVLGGLNTGIFTANEAAGIGAFGAFLFAAIRWGRATLKHLVGALVDAVRITATIMAVFLAAIVFTAFINRTGLPGDIIASLSSYNLGKTELVLVIALICVALSTVFEEIGILVLLVPAFVPALKAAGVDMIWFGITFIFVMQIGLIMPPIGMNVFTVKTMAPSVPLAKIYRGAWIFVAADFAALGLIIAIPQIATWLPGKNLALR